MNPGLLKNTKTTRAMNAVAVGTTTQTGSILDMQGFDGVIFIALLGAITDGTPSLKAAQGQAANLSDAADLEGSSTPVTADTDDNKALILDVYRPGERYVRPAIVRGGATGCVIDGVIAIQYQARKKPTTQDTTVAASKALASPAEGTA